MLDRLCMHLHVPTLETICIGIYQHNQTAKVRLPPPANTDLAHMSHGNHIPPIIGEGDVSNTALRLLELERDVRANLAEGLTDFISFDMHLTRSGSSTARRNASGSPCRCGGVVTDVATASIVLYHVKVPEVDLSSGGAHGEERVEAGKSEEAEVHEEWSRVVGLELEKTLVSAAKGRACVAVFVRGGCKLGRWRWILRTEVLDCPEDDGVLVCGSRYDVVAVERNTAAAGRLEGYIPPSRLTTGMGGHGEVHTSRHSWCGSWRSRSAGT